ncbi:ParA family protein [Leptospira kmetyi]|uniref:Chromosome partitioning protein ParA n=1 Tax=Leptospira kmetyi TaxID=408139 RepID=A0ABX4N6W4_9LEPT|nr:ParA family protein [Leptospira kmetyi]PJZ29128.1 chromosome partitioning protein ParA [Leptospira kmetyi]PJZ39769.1 chromosome partitioning protein ParA [Leptospira kmetyi]
MGHNILTIANPKGGVSKTTTTGHLSMALSQKGRVCAIDFDRQKDLSRMFFLGQPDSFFEHANTLTLLKYETSFKDTVKRQYGVDVIISASNLRNFSMEVAKDISFLERAKEILRDPNEETIYDFILIDTPGTGIFETTSAILASDIAIIPVTPQKWSIDTLKDFFKDINDAIKSGSPLTKIFLLPSLWGDSAEKEEIYEQILRIPDITKGLKKSEPGFDLIPIPTILNQIPSSGPIQKRSEYGEPLAEGTKGRIAFENLAERIFNECKTETKKVRLAR